MTTTGPPLEAAVLQELLAEQVRTNETLERIAGTLTALADALPTDKDARWWRAYNDGSEDQRRLAQTGSEHCPPWVTSILRPDESCNP